MSYSATKGKKRKAIQKQYDLHHGLGKSVPRGSSKATITSNSNSMNINHNNNNNKKKKKTGCYDLNVSLPKIKKTTISFTRLQEIIKRLADLGYTTIALTHSIFGRYDKESDVDFGHVSIPFTFQSHGEDNNLKKKKNSGDSDVRKEVVVETYGMKVLKRLNIIIEEMSDLSYYTSNESNNKLGKKVENDSEDISFLHRLYESYDLISFTPRTESTFSSLCQSKNIMFDILTLDYTIGNASMSSTSGRKFGGGGGGGLPYTLRGSDFTAIFSSSSSSSEIPPVLELNYAPAISDPSKRRNWIVTATEYQNVVSTLSKTTMRKISSDNNNNSNNRKAVSMFSSTASRGKKKNPHEKVRARMIVSSGIRKYKPQSTDGAGYQQDDLGALALRSSHDITNVLNVVLGLNEYKECTNEFCDYVLQKAYLRKSGVHSYTLGNSSENNQQQMLGSNHRNVEVLLGCHDHLLSASNSSIPKAGDSFQLASRQKTKDNHQPLPSSQHSVAPGKDSEESNSSEDDNVKVDTHNNDTENTDKNSKSDQEEEDEDDGIIMFT